MNTHTVTLSNMDATETVRWECSCGAHGTAHRGPVGESGYRHPSQTARALAQRQHEGHVRAVKTGNK